MIHDSTHYIKEAIAKYTPDHLGEYIIFMNITPIYPYSKIILDYAIQDPSAQC